MWSKSLIILIGIWSIVGFDNGSEKEKGFNGKSADAINADLTATVDLTQAHRLSENANLAFQGPVKVGPFDIENKVAQEMFGQTNLHGRPNSDVIRPWKNASDIVGRPRGMWIIDFGEMEIEDAALFEAPFEYVRREVKPMRDTNHRAKRKDYWWQHGETVPGLRNISTRLQRFICTPRVAKHRIFVWESTGLLPDSRLYLIARDDDYFFGVLHSRIHEVWSLATSSRHGVGNDPTYNNTTCFETFPFPWPPGAEAADDPRVQAIAQAAAELVTKRDAWLYPPGLDEKQLAKRTLTNLYNQRPTWLDLLHKRLDAAVAAAYGWPADLADEEILERLLALNLQRAVGG